jgi:hypothetical protein
MKAFYFTDILQLSDMNSILTELGIEDQELLETKDITKIKMAIAEKIGAVVFSYCSNKKEVVLFETNAAYTWYVLRWKR